MRRVNPILQADSYKAGHFKIYPPGADYVTSYLTARRGPFRDVQFFGLQAVLDDYFTDPVTQADVEEAAAILEAHGEPFNREGWEAIVNDFGGRLPILVRALPEGAHAAFGEPLLLVRNTAPGFGWLTSYVETKLMRVWYPTTVATLSRSLRDHVDSVAQITSDDPSVPPFRLHDFGARGATGGEAAAYGGMAHLTNFLGSDTLEGLVAARDYYGEPMAAFSVVATEHSTMTAWGEAGEIDAFRQTIRECGGPGKIVSIVSDSWDTRRVLNEYLPALKAEIVATGTVVVVRLDSGEPVEMVMTALRSLGETFGYVINSKGYRVLNDVRVLQGDGINGDTLKDITAVMTLDGWAIDNIVFGMGGALLQKVNRDTLGFAYKACEVVLNGEARQIHKRSEDEWKASKTLAELDTSRLVSVYSDGVVTKRWALGEIRERAAGLEG